MTATMKIEDEKKEKLDKFIASLLFQERVKITYQEAVGLMVDYALENQEEFKSRSIDRKLKCPTIHDPASQAEPDC